MKKVVIACDTLYDELTRAHEETNCDSEIIWIEGNLHNFPEKLRSMLQSKLDEINDCDYVLFSFGFCGNSIAGLKAGNHTLVIPRAEDCIALLHAENFGGECEKRLTNVFYLTNGWINHDPNIWTEYESSVELYGEDTAKVVMQSMYAHYDKISVLDTDTFEIEPVQEIAKKAAEAFELKCDCAKGSLNALKALLTGPWDDTALFVCVPPGGEILESNLYL